VPTRGSGPRGAGESLLHTHEDRQASPELREPEHPGNDGGRTLPRAPRRGGAHSLFVAILELLVARWR